MSQRRIYVFCPDVERRIGGVRTLYRHVDILNEQGLDAVIVHQKPGFRARWLERDTPVVYAADQMRENLDVAVFPEVWWPKANRCKAGVHRVIFSQNAYYTHDGCPLKPFVPLPYTRPETLGAIVMSEDSRQYLKRAYPRLNVQRIWCSIDRELYLARPKKKQLCIVPRKNQDHLRQVLYLLNGRGALRDWPVVLADPTDHVSIAEAVGESAIYLSFDSPEGFAEGLMSAMWASCVTIGYSGEGGKELMDPEFSFEVPMGDIWGFVQTVQRVMEEFELNAERLTRMGRRAKAFVEQEYTEERERNSILSCWQEFLGEAGGI